MVEELERAGGNKPPEVVLADAGYWHQQQMERIVGDALPCLSPPTHGHGLAGGRAKAGRGRDTGARISSAVNAASSAADFLAPTNLHFSSSVTRAPPRILPQPWRQRHPNLTFISLKEGRKSTRMGITSSGDGVEDVLSSLSALAAHQVGWSCPGFSIPLMGRQAAR